MMSLLQAPRNRAPRAWTFSLGRTVLLAGLATLVPGADQIVIKAIAGLQYDVKQFAVQPGEAVKILFENADTTDMPHNFIITAPGAREVVVNAAMELGADAEQAGYVPKVPQVLWAIPAIGPEGHKTLSFKAPATAGIYPYVCTLPGHGPVMFGAMYVGTPMPAEAAAPVPTEGAPTDSEDVHAHHHGGAAEKPAPSAQAVIRQRPAVIRTFMPESGPAAIAVALPGTWNYCWDAGTCRFRYAWTGDFIDNFAYWKGNGDGLAKLLGPVAYRAPSGQPLRRSADQEPQVAFQGYRLKDGQPTFTYTLDGLAVQETLAAEAGGGLTWRFAVATDQALVYRVDPAAEGRFTSSVGRFTGGILAIPAGKARAFTITLSAPSAGGTP